MHTALFQTIFTQIELGNPIIAKRHLLIQQTPFFLIKNQPNPSSLIGLYFFMMLAKIFSYTLINYKFLSHFFRGAVIIF